MLHRRPLEANPHPFSVQTLPAPCACGVRTSTCESDMAHTTQRRLEQRTNVSAMQSPHHDGRVAMRRLIHYDHLDTQAQDILHRR